MEYLQLAENIINHAFKNKVDKGGKPYVEHCYAVYNAVKSLYPGNETPQCIALLHDLLEDCPEWSEGALRCLFPERVVDSVVLLTRKRNQSYEDYLKELSGDGFALSVKLADLRHNMDITRLAEITNKDIERLKKYHAAYHSLKS